MNKHDKEDMLNASNMLQNAANQLMNGVTWADTVEGQVYWLTQYRHLEALALQLEIQANG